MQSEIKYAPSYSLAMVTLTAGEAIQVESGSMVSMSPGIEMETKSKGGLLGGLKRSVLGGESFFLNTFTAPSGGQITMAPALPGDIYHTQMAGRTVFIQSGSYMASSPSIEIDTKWGGSKTFFSSEGLFLLRASGAGDLFVSSYGAIHEIDLGAGEHYTMDTGHMVAFEEGVGYEVRKVGGWKSTLLSGEGLVVDLTGPGKVYMQTRSPQGFLAWLIPQLPKTSN